MISFYDELMERLKESDLGLNIYEAYSPATPQYPALFVHEAINREHVSISGEERVTLIGYRFEIFTRADYDLETKQVVSRRQKAQQLAHQLDEWIREHYGLTRMGDPVYLPSADDTVGRYIVTYKGLVSNGYIYQREG